MEAPPAISHPPTNPPTFFTGEDVARGRPWKRRHVEASKRQDRGEALQGADWRQAVDVLGMADARGADSREASDGFEAFDTGCGSVGQGNGKWSPKWLALVRNGQRTQNGLPW